MNSDQMVKFFHEPQTVYTDSFAVNAAARAAADIAAILYNIKLRLAIIFNIMRELLMMPKVQTFKKIVTGTYMPWIF